MRHRAIPLVVASVIALALFAPVPAHAANAVTKLGRGIVNTGTGWLEVPVRIGDAKQDGTAVLWLVTGAFEGIAYGLTRTFYGIWDIVSFPIPPYDRPVLDPETLITEQPPRRTSAD